MHWTYLFLAAGLEIVMGVALKLNKGWTQPTASVGAVAAALGSIYLLAMALRSLPVGTAYAIWTGIGTLGLVIIGVVAFNEEVSWSRGCFMALAFIGIIGLRYSEAAGN